MRGQYFAALKMIQDIRPLDFSALAEEDFWAEYGITPAKDGNQCKNVIGGYATAAAASNESADNDLYVN